MKWDTVVYFASFQIFFWHLTCLYFLMWPLIESLLDSRHIRMSFATTFLTTSLRAFSCPVKDFVLSTTIWPELGLVHSRNTIKAWLKTSLLSSSTGKTTWSSIVFTLSPFWLLPTFYTFINNAGVNILAPLCLYNQNSYQNVPCYRC